MSSTPLAIETHDVRRIYKIRGGKRKGEAKTLIALDGVSLEVPRGELFGLLGPNGAGKTTLIKILATLLLPSSGTAKVDGLDVTTQTQEVRRRISMVSGGETSGFGLLTVEENLWMFARFYGLDNKTIKSRLAEMMQMVGIYDRRSTKISDLSTGLRQKMNFIRGFISDPSVVFLDEPTLGLDVTAARDVRGFVKDWMAQNPDRTLLLTTHYMAEADELCDRLAIIDRGKTLICDTPENLKRRLQSETIFHLKIQPLRKPTSPENVVEAVPGVRSVTIADQTDFSELRLSLQGEEALPAVLSHLSGRGSGLLSLEKREPTLEDVFIQLVGRRLDEDTNLNGTGEER
ncbi:MAG: ABC transporter ATP-binding protein [Anaerolineae bacterium]|nr:ABC transporter ATP-binding protein [Anaerolineae bacterium]